MIEIPRTKLWPHVDRDGGWIALCTGCFDVIHRGHLEMFIAASWRYTLVVGLNSDAAIRKLKGPTRPINCEADRMFMVAALGCVSSVLLIDSDTVDGAIREVEPRAWIKGGDWKLETLNPLEVAAAREVGARIEIVPALEGYSSTKIIERMKR